MSTKIAHNMFSEVCCNKKCSLITLGYFHFKDNLSTMVNTLSIIIFSTVMFNKNNVLIPLR